MSSSSASPLRSPTLRPHRMKKDETFLGKLGGTLARKKKAKEGERASWERGPRGTLRGETGVAGSLRPISTGVSKASPKLNNGDEIRKLSRARDERVNALSSLSLRLACRPLFPCAWTFSSHV
ncbi:hypothetical protein lerEdw1_000655 [Lerista edwardsae]|nr:hypothetical protein lerEdw1_000655 [Lerista edwardsae]